MWKNTYEQYFSPSFLREKVYSEWTLPSSHASLPELPTNYSTFLPQLKEDDSNQLLSEQALHVYALEAEEGLAQIQDPLWQRVCSEILQTLGPVAFKDIWKTEFIGMCPEGKRAFLSCPTKEIALSLEQYHFVIIDALKKFYPCVTLLETEICSPQTEYKVVNKH